MKISAIETCAVSAGWKNWLLVKVITDSGIYGIGEGTLNGVIRTTEDPKAYLNIFQDGWEKRLGRQPADKP